MVFEEPILYERAAWAECCFFAPSNDLKAAPGTIFGREEGMDFREDLVAGRKGERGGRKHR